MALDSAQEQSYRRLIRMHKPDMMEEGYDVIHRITVEEIHGTIGGQSGYMT